MIQRSALPHSSKPINRKRSKPRRGVVKDPAYLEFISGHKCCVCISWETEQATPTEVAHVGERGLGQKCDDRQTLPICERHHKTGKLALHVLGKAFWGHHGMDRDKLVKEYQEKYVTF